MRRGQATWINGLFEAKELRVPCEWMDGEREPILAKAGRQDSLCLGRREQVGEINPRSSGMPRFQGGNGEL